MSENWRPSTSGQLTKIRADLLRHIRNFMDVQGITEVETPIMVSAPVTDPALENFEVNLASTERVYYLHTSPEFAMKRLLADGSDPIYQITKVFREGETGPLHNPEFTMLEWYQPGFDQFQLMQVVDTLLLSLGFPTSQRNTYQDIFSGITGIDPLTASDERLSDFANNHGLSSKLTDRSDILDYIFSHVIADKLSGMPPTFIHDFPLRQAALAKSNPDGLTAARFELFINGIEIANGFQELTDAEEQRLRFEQDNIRRKEKGLREKALDEKFLAALEAGLPECSGVALGIDRLLMVMHGYKHINDVIHFTTGSI